MFHGVLPFLTKGPLALFFGGNPILPHLSEQSPGYSFPLLVIFSTVFQATMYMYTKYTGRPLQKNTVMHNIRMTLVNNVLNIYGVALVIIFNIIALVCFVLHFFGTEKNKEKGKLTQLIPDGIFFISGVSLFMVMLPFLRSHALRWAFVVFSKLKMNCVSEILLS